MAETKADIQIFNQTHLTLPVSDSTFRKTASIVGKYENREFILLEVVYVDEDEIVRINKEHLKRDYVTDIITFRYDDPDDGEVEGTLFCCAPRIFEQADELGETPEKEFLRIYIHGLLHLVGYEDKTDPQKQQMTAKENTYLELMGRQTDS
ncbi:MAG TPA: rRNA maturation RNase YbeY [Balneolaceae bacterium]|nr:rRNA maturation RNase YbeY [Balneolaceae bacterium]